VSVVFMWMLCEGIRTITQSGPTLVSLLEGIGRRGLSLPAVQAAVEQAWFLLSRVPDELQEPLRSLIAQARSTVPQLATVKALNPGNVYLAMVAVLALTSTYLYFSLFSSAASTPVRYASEAVEIGTAAGTGKKAKKEEEEEDEEEDEGPDFILTDLPLPLSKIVPSSRTRSTKAMNVLENIVVEFVQPGEWHIISFGELTFIGLYLILLGASAVTIGPVLSPTRDYSVMALAVGLALTATGRRFCSVTNTFAYHADTFSSVEEALESKNETIDNFVIEDVDAEAVETYVSAYARRLNCEDDDAVAIQVFFIPTRNPTDEVNEVLERYGDESDSDDAES